MTSMAMGAEDREVLNAAVASLLYLEVLRYRDSVNRYPIRVCRAVLELLTLRVVLSWKGDRLARSPVVYPMRSTSTAGGSERGEGMVSSPESPVSVNVNKRFGSVGENAFILDILLQYSIL